MLLRRDCALIRSRCRRGHEPDHQDAGEGRGQRAVANPMTRGYATARRCATPRLNRSNPFVFDLNDGANLAIAEEGGGLLMRAGMQMLQRG